MKHLMGLGFAALLGIVAAGLNWIWISGLALPDEYVAIKSDVNFGSELSDEDLRAIPIPGEKEVLRESFIPWKNRAILFGTNANRQYVAGDVVFHRDILAPAEDSGWTVIGPFKLICVGERFKERGGEELDYSQTGGNNVTIAVDAEFDTRTKKLLEVIRKDSGRNQQQAPIVAVQVLPTNQQAERIRSVESGNVVFQTVSLEGIANVPRVLLAGDRIRFVVPSRSIN